MREHITVYYYTNYHKTKRRFHCSCGYKHETMFKGDFKCPDCGNELLIYLDREYKTKLVTSDIFAIEVGMKNFHVAKERYRLVFHKDGSIGITYLGNEELKFHITDGIQMSRDGEDLGYIDEKRIKTFFKDIGKEKILDIISNEVNRDLYNFAYMHYYGRKGRSWNYDRDMGYALKGLVGKTHIEIMYFSGFNNTDHLKQIDDNSHYYNFRETKPHKILNCPKSFIPILKQIPRWNYYDLREMKKFFETVGGNNFKTIFDIVAEEVEFKFSIQNFCNYFTELYNNYGYKNIQRLTEYVARDLKLQQGIEDPVTGLILLRDYVRMMTDLDFSYEKYSKSLKKDHDIASMNYKIVQDKIFAEKLASRVQEFEYKALELKDKEWSIIRPLVADDVIKEGESLSHCVASYVKDIAKGLCKILFLRRTQALDDSCVTIEVRGSNVKQVRGKSNRLPTEEEKEFVKKWAEKKELNVSY